MTSLPSILISIDNCIVALCETNMRRNISYRLQQEWEFMDQEPFTALPSMDSQDVTNSCYKMMASGYMSRRPQKSVISSSPSPHQLHVIVHPIHMWSFLTFYQLCVYFTMKIVSIADSQQNMTNSAYKDNWIRWSLCRFIAEDCYHLSKMMSVYSTEYATLFQTWYDFIFPKLILMCPNSRGSSN